MVCPLTTGELVTCIIIIMIAFAYNLSSKVAMLPNCVDSQLVTMIHVIGGTLLEWALLLLMAWCKAPAALLLPPRQGRPRWLWGNPKFVPFLVWPPLGDCEQNQL